VTITDTDANASIYYTTNGSAPTSASTPYPAGGITLSTTGSATIKAIAIDGITDSPVATATYTVSPASVAAPSFNPASGATVASGSAVTISDTDANAAIYYTTNGSVPSASSTAYTAPVVLSTAGAATIKAIAIDGATTSAVASATYTVAGAGASITGTVLSGTTGVDGATVQLYAAGNTGYGSTATAVGSSASTNGSGAFTLSLSCPSNSSLVYLVATGGSTTAGDTNADLEMMTALGPCGSIASGASFTIDEVTTVASAYALAQFMTTAPNVGSSSANYAVGLTNAFAAVNNLVNVNSGAALSVTPAYSQTFAQDINILNNSTVPTARINTLANILNSCASTANGNGCSAGLFTDATPPSGTAPTNTLQAILDIAQNPGANVSALYGLATTAFSNALSAAPNDWTLALTFTGGGLGIAPNETLTYTSGGNSATTSLAIIDTSLAVDAAGNIWVTAYADNNPSLATISTDSVSTLVAEFNALGAPATPATAISSGNVTFGGFDPDTADATAALSASAIDEAGNLWFTEYIGSGGNLVEMSPQLSVLQPSFGPGEQGIFVAVNSSNDIWASFTAVDEFTATGTQVTLTPGAEGTATAPSNLVFDSSGNLWATPTDDVVQLDANAGIVNDQFPGMSGSVTTLAADGAGNIYGCGGSNNQQLNVFKAGVSGPVTSYAINTTRGCGTQLVLDGQGHLFAVSNVNTGAPVAAVDEFSTAGAQISPIANGYTGTSGSEAPTLNPDIGYFGQVPGVGAAIDPSGNLWVLNNDTNGPSSSGNVLVEFIGLAAPVVTPTSVALKNGQLGSRP
jgi:streptogramin lyase